MSSNKKKVFGGVFAALLALFAAVVVATPAVADPAETMSPLEDGGWYIVATGTEEAPSGITSATNITSVPSTGITISPIAGETQSAITIALNGANAATNPITFSNLGSITSSNTLININGSVDTFVNFEGTTNLTTSGTALAIGNNADVTLGGTGTATFTSTNSSNAAINNSGNADIVVADSLDLTASMSGGSVGSLALGTGTLTVGGKKSDATVTLNNTGSGPALVEGSKDGNVVTVQSGSSLNCTVKSPSVRGPAVDLGRTGNLVLNGSMSIELTGTGNMAALTADEILLGTADAPATGASLSVTANPNANITNLVSATALANYGGTVEVTANVTAPTGTKAETLSVNGVNLSGKLTAVSDADTSLVVANGGSVEVDVTAGSGTGLTSANAISVGTSVNGDNTEGILSVDAPGIATTVTSGNLTLAAGTVEATSTTATAIKGNVVASGGTLVASGGAPTASTVDSTPGYGIEGTVAVSNASRSANGGPTLTVSTTDTSAGSKAISSTITPDTVQDTPNAASNYKWVYVTGGTNAASAATAEKPQPVLPMEIYDYAGRAEDTALTAPVYNQVVIMPNPIVSFVATVSPANSSKGATLVSGSSPMPNGYVVANNVSVTTSTSDLTNVFAYSAKMAPSFQNSTYPLADNVAGAAANDVTTIFNGINSGSSPTVVTVNNAKAAFALTNKFTGTTVPLTLATDEAPNLAITGLYPEGSLGVTMNPIPVSYQVSFNANGTSATAQPAESPTVTKAEAGAFGYENDNIGVYFTEPGGDTILNGIPSITDTSKNVPVAALPTVNPQASFFLGWYQINSATDATVPVLADPLTEVPTANANVTYAAVYGVLDVDITNGVLEGSPQTIMAGETATYTVPVTVKLAPNNMTPYRGLKITDINLDPSVIEVGKAVNMTAKGSTSDKYVSNIWLAYTSTGAPVTNGGYSGTMNGVTFGDITVSDVSNGAFVISIPVNTGKNSTQGIYNMNVYINEAGQADTSPVKLQGALTIDGVAEDAPVAVMRLYNPYNGEHLLTTAQNEITANLNAGWRPDGIAWYSPAAGDPVYRLYNPYSHDHYYTSNTEEIAGLVKLGWVKDFETTDGQTPVFYSDTENSLYPIVQFFNPYVTEGTHLWTMDMNEIDTLEDAGWEYQGVKWYALMPGVSLA